VFCMGMLIDDGACFLEGGGFVIKKLPQIGSVDFLIWEVESIPVFIGPDCTVESCYHLWIGNHGRRGMARIF